MPRFYIRIPGQTTAAIVETTPTDGIFAAHLTHPDYKGAAGFRGMNEPDVIAAVYRATALHFKVAALTVVQDGAPEAGPIVVEARDSTAYREAATTLAKASHAYSTRAAGIWAAAVGWCRAMQSFRPEEAARAILAREELEAEGRDLAALSITVDPQAFSAKKPKR